MTPVRVLAVDDNPSFLAVVVSLLKESDRLEVVGSVQDSRKARDEIAEAQPDVVLLDLNMPGVTGRELILELRREHPEMGLVVLTLLEPELYREPCLEAGADEFVCKPNMVSELLPAVERAAKARRAVAA